MGSREEFIADLYPAARRVAQQTGMSWELILAQAAQETGWGQRMLPGTNNVFNIKADASWDGPRRTFNVPEFIDGRRVNVDADFRVYGSYDESLRDRMAFLRDNPRYARAGLFAQGTAGDFQAEARALQRAGYATDPRYAEALVETFNGPTMRRALALAQEREQEAPRREGAAPAARREGAGPVAQGEGATRGTGTWPAPGNHALNLADKPGEGGGQWNAPRRHRDGDGHDGIDIQGREGDAVVAWRGGTARAYSQPRGAGNYIEIDHGDGTTSRYMHLGTMRVPPGQSFQVREGERIGTMGRSGNVPDQGDTHLHFEIRRQGRDVDPMPLLGRTAGGSGREGASAREPAHPAAMADGVLKSGDRGPEVVALQRQLNALGYRGRDGEPLETRSGIFGPDTEHAVRGFQRAHGIAVDGKAGGRETLPAIERAARHPLVSEATHPGQALFADVSRRIGEQAGQPPTREAVANITLQMMENGIRSPADIRGLRVDGSNVHVQGPVQGDRVSVDLQAPTAPLQAMSDHMARQADERVQAARETRQQVVPTVAV